MENITGKLFYGNNPNMQRLRIVVYNFRASSNMHYAVLSIGCAVRIVQCATCSVQCAANRRAVCSGAKKTEHAAKARTFSAVENPAQQIWVSTSFETDLRFESAYLHFPDCFEQLLDAHA